MLQAHCLPARPQSPSVYCKTLVLMEEEAAQVAIRRWDGEAPVAQSKLLASSPILSLQWQHLPWVLKPSRLLKGECGPVGGWSTHSSRFSLHCIITWGRLGVGRRFLPAAAVPDLWLYLLLPTYLASPASSWSLPFASATPAFFLSH